MAYAHARCIDRGASIINEAGSFSCSGRDAYGRWARSRVVASQEEAKSRNNRTIRRATLRWELGQRDT